MKLSILTNLTIAWLISAGIAYSQNDKIGNIENIGKSDSQIVQAVDDSLPVSDTLVIPTLDFRNADVRDVLRSLADKYGFNIWFSPEVKGLIPIHLTKIKVKDAVKFIVDHYGFKYQVRNNVVEVYKREELEGGQGASAIRITLKAGKIFFDLRDAELDSAVRQFCKLTGVNVVVEREVKGRVTGFLSDLDPRKGMVLLLESNGYEVKETGGVIKVGLPRQATGAEGLPPGTYAPGYGGGRLTVKVEEGRVHFDLVQADLRQTINELAAQSGLNLFLYGDIQGMVTARADSLKVETALQYLLQNTRYTFWKKESVYFVGDGQALQVPNSELVELRYIKADETVEMLPKAILEKAVVKVVKGQNGLMVIGPYDVISSARDYLRLVDRPISQILVEALVVDFSLERLNEYGLKLFTLGSNDSSAVSNQYYPSLKATANDKQLNKIMARAMDLFSVKQIVKLPSDFRAQIGFLENMGLANIQSTPQVATLNGHTAEIRIGTKEYMLLTSEQETGDNVYRRSTTERLESYEANISLSITPWVTTNREVTVEVKPLFQIPGRSPLPGKIPPPINTREIKSTVRLKDGETYVLGGMITTNVEDTKESVPLLGRIPYLGRLFSYSRKRSVRNKMMIFLTPHIYYGSEGAVDAGKMVKEWEK